MYKITYNPPVQAELDFQNNVAFTAQTVRSPAFLPTSSGSVAVKYVRNRRARRYLLRVQEDGTARVTLPQWGSKAHAYAFAQRETRWIEKQLEKRRASPFAIKSWSEGTSFLFRGELVLIQIDEAGRLRFADQEISCDAKQTFDVGRRIESHLRNLAIKELIPRTMGLARLHGLNVKRVIIRNQRSRWGSCSVRGTISLNWRLIQTPPMVVDYIIMHELMHLREMNHSPRFWRHVAAAFPEYRAAEKWLKQNPARWR